MRWQAFLALRDDKADLAWFRSDDIIMQAPVDTTIVVSGSGCSNEADVLCSDPSLNVAVWRSNHEEAETKFVLHAVSHGISTTQ